MIQQRLALRYAAAALLLLAAFAHSEEMPPGNFELTVNSEQRISLTANGASLEAIVTELGAQLGAEVTGALSEDKHVTAQLWDVSVAEALGHIGDSYVLISDARDGETQRIILLGKGQDGQNAAGIEIDPAGIESETSQGGFQFEFDPGAAPIQEETTEQNESSPDQ